MTPGVKLRTKSTVAAGKAPEVRDLLSSRVLKA